LRAAIFQHGDPYGGYPLEALYEDLKTIGLQAPIGARYEYSNLGYGLLGHALERAAGEPYEALLRKHLLEPLEMRDTALDASKELRGRLAAGYREDDPRREAASWDLGCLAPAGGIASTIPDLARFISLQHRAGEAGVKPVAGGTLVELHTPQRLLGGWKAAVGLGWHVTPDPEAGDIVWHNGGLAGHRSYLGFSRRRKVGIVVLTNCGKSVDALGLWMLKAACKLPAEGPSPGGGK
jgi:CubicO group peptidase (beta-lactamase class C family)